MIFLIKKLIIYILLKKLIRSGKQNKSIKIKNFLKILTSKGNLLLESVFNLIVPFSFKIKKIGYIKYHIPILIHYYKSINLALRWLINASKQRSRNKMSFIKAFYLECCDIKKKQGISYKFKKQYIKKALINRTFLYLINLKK